MKDGVVLRAAKAVTEEFPWGGLSWFAGAKLGNSRTMTFGRCVIRPGCENPKHRHPNCEEILHLLTGRIVHYVGDEECEMGPGDTITILPGCFHNARNVGSEAAVMVVAFSSAERQMERYGGKT